MINKTEETEMENDAQKVLDECDDVDMLGTQTMDLGQFNIDLNQFELNF